MPGLRDPYRWRKPAEHLQGIQESRERDWHVFADALLYYTWSQGFRPGAFKPQRRLLHSGQSGHRAVLLAAGIHIRQSHQQRGGVENRVFRPPPAMERRPLPGKMGQCADRVLRPGVLGNVGFGANGPNYRVRGLETSLIAALLPGSPYRDRVVERSKQTNSPYLIANNPSC